MLELLLNLTTAFGLAGSAGLNAYIPLLTIGLLARAHEVTGGSPLVTLNQPWDLLAHPITLGVLFVLITIEFFADKVPAVNHVNDVLQTFVRPAAGVIAFAASTGAIGVDPVVAIVCGLLLAGSVHVVKSAIVRPVVTATTGGAANPIVSTVEDIIALGVSLLAILLPILMAIVLFFTVLFMLWVLARRLAPATENS